MREAIEDTRVRMAMSRGAARQDSVFHTLLYTIFQKPRETASGGIVVALSSANPGEGVTYVARALIHELGNCEFTSVAGVNVGFLRKLHEPTLEAIRKSLSGLPSGLVAAGAGPASAQHTSLSVERRASSPWEGSWQYRRDCIDLLRSEFDYTIIDCPSLKVSGDVLSVAPFVDGVILVIEANRTHREDPCVARRRITAAGGTVLGYILNKRTYDVPEWLYCRL